MSAEAALGSMERERLERVRDLARELQPLLKDVITSLPDPAHRLVTARVQQDLGLVDYLAVQLLRDRAPS